MVSNLRQTATLRGLRGKLISPLVLIACISLMAAPSGHAGLLDQLNQATQAVQQIKNNIFHNKPNSPSSPTNSQPMAPSSSQSNQTPNAVALVRKFRSIIPSYSGASMDMLGVRLGMSLPQAEEIAKKTYTSNPRVVYAKYLFNYKEVRVVSRRFVKYVRYTKTAGYMTDQLQLTFNGPVGDDRIVSMERLINFSDPFDNHADTANIPLATTVQASLIKKYGIPSAISKFQNSVVTLWWLFTKSSRLSCPQGSCFDAANNGDDPTAGGPMEKFGNGIYPFDLTYGHFTRPGQPSCGAIFSSSGKLISNDDVRIKATIQLDQTDSSKAYQLEVHSYYIKPCLDAIVDARSQMKEAAIKRYDSISKNPAAPSL